MEIIRNTSNHCTEIIERDGKKEITGYGAIYYDNTPGSEYQIGPNLYERFAKGFADTAIASGQNIVVRYNHDDNFILDDTDNGAKVKADDKGIKYSVPFDSQDPDHLKVKSKIEKGLIRGSSIAATNPKYSFTEEGSKHIAWVTSVERVIDCSPVNNPAYKNAPAMLRSAELNEQYETWLKSKAETSKRIAKYL